MILYSPAALLSSLLLLLMVNILYNQFAYFGMIWSAVSCCIGLITTATEDMWLQHPLLEVCS